ncbi:hypothetical protein [Labilibaculum sp.]|uniref:hypothetical protein n=1 Tax=Labilibaculum sp. TaxID=2060723 RepID=UPI00356AD8D8
MKYISVFFICVFCVSCNLVQKQNKEKDLGTAKGNQIHEKVISIDEIMENADKILGKEFCFNGLVNHICAHSGKRCILKNANGTLSIRVEATGELKGFDKELVGHDIMVTGILREKRLDQVAIAKQESEVKAKHAMEENGENCSSEMANIKEMRDWMREKNKDYYAIYYVDGKSYEVLE